MKLLAIDTSASLCAACVFDTETGAVEARVALDIGKGHAERLMGVVGDALAEAGLDYPLLGAVGVSVGPGSFTGVRVGVATARGLALALKIPAIGVTTLEAIAAQARREHPGRPVLALIDAKREEIYAALYDAEGAETAAPAALHLDAVIGLAVQNSTAVLAGSGAVIAAQVLTNRATTLERAATADIEFYAGLAASRTDVSKKPAPLYLRAPDARPQQAFALPRKVS